MVEHYLRAAHAQWKALGSALPGRSGLSNADIVRAYLGLLVHGKSVFNAIEGDREDKSFKETLGFGLLASSLTLRQCMKSEAVALFEIVPAINERRLASQRPDYGWLPL